MEKILFIGHESDLNGASKSLLNIISSLEGKKQVYVLTSFDNGPFYEELKKHKVKILVYPYYRWLVQRHCSRFSLKSELIWLKQRLLWKLKESRINEVTADAIAEFVKKEKISVIHSNTSVVNIGAILKQRLGSAVKHIWHIREFGDLDFDMHPLIDRQAFFKFMNDYTDTFICISKKIAQHYSLLLEDKKVVVYNGIDQSNYFSDHEEHIGVNFLISGRISETKGQKEAVQACNEILKAGYRDFKLYVAGEGELYFQVPEECKEHVVLLGLIKDMPSIRKKMDVELVCSKAEAFGRVTAEAMMGGMPVIGSNTGGTPELIIDGKTGFLYEYGDINDLAQKMLCFLKEPLKIKEMGSEAQKYALEHFTIERCVGEIEALYSSI